MTATHKTFSHVGRGMTGTEHPPGTIPFRFCQPPLTPPQCFSINSCSGILISSSTTQGLFTCPLMQNTFVPEFLSLPKLANHLPPLRAIVGATATVSTFATVEGHPKSPTSAGNGGLSRGFPCFPSSDSIRAVSSPQIYAPAPRCR